MSVRGWGGSIATAIGVAACAGAAQLGFGYGLGIITWVPAGNGTSEAAWVASLAWAAWIAATSTVVGALCANRISVSRSARSTVDGRWPAPASMATSLWRVSLALASTVGGLVTVALVAVPARAATHADAYSPQVITAGYAVIGVLVGLLMAIWALSSPAVAGNVVATIGWLWLLAVVAVANGVLSGRGLTSAQLGVWQITSDSERFWIRDYFYWPGAALSLGSAFVIGTITARTAARRAESRVGAAVSGVVGPLLVAVAYFLAAPRLVGIRAEQLSAHLMAPYAVIAGLAGSVLVASLAQRRETNRLAEAAALPPGAEAAALPPGTTTALPPGAKAAPPPGATAHDEPAAVQEKPIVVVKQRRGGSGGRDSAGGQVVSTAPGDADPAGTGGRAQRRRTRTATPQSDQPAAKSEPADKSTEDQATDRSTENKTTAGDGFKGKLARLARRSR